MELVPINVKRDWVKWLEEQNKPTPVTETDVILDAAQRAGVALGKKYGWDSVEVRMGDKCVHMEYMWCGGLYYAMIPVRLIKETSSLQPHMEDAVIRLHIQLIQLGE